MSVTLLKTLDDSYAIQVDTTLKLHGSEGNTEANLGDTLKMVCFNELSEASVFLRANRTYVVRGTICIQDVTEDETDSTQSK